MTASFEKFSQDEAPKSTQLEAVETAPDSRAYWFGQLNQHFRVEDLANEKTEQDYRDNLSKYGDKKVFIESLIGIFTEKEQKAIQQYKAKPEAVREILISQDVIRIVMRDMHSNRDKIRSALWGVQILDQYEAQDIAAAKAAAKKRRESQTIVDVSRDEMQSTLANAEKSTNEELRNGKTIITDEKVENTLDTDTLPTPTPENLNPIITQEIHNIFSFKITDARVQSPEFQSGLQKILDMTRDLLDSQRNSDLMNGVISERPWRDWRVLIAFARNLQERRFFDQVAASVVQNGGEQGRAQYENLLWLSQNHNREQIIFWMENLKEPKDETKTINLKADPYGLRDFKNYSSKVDKRIKKTCEILVHRYINLDDYRAITQGVGHVLEEFTENLRSEQIGRSFREMEVLNGHAKITLGGVKVMLSSVRAHILHAHHLAPSQVEAIVAELDRLTYKASYTATYILKKTDAGSTLSMSSAFYKVA